MQVWPEWWNWEIELSPHVLKRMIDRQFTEPEVRAMLEDSTGYHSDVEDGRFVIETRHESRQWEVIVEPDNLKQVLVVVTAYWVMNRNQ